jgi:hypothetical protein
VELEKIYSVNLKNMKVVGSMKPSMHTGAQYWIEVSSSLHLSVVMVFKTFCSQDV